MQQAAQISPQVMESVPAPERVETQVGTPEFPLGVPTDETAGRLYDHLARPTGACSPYVFAFADQEGVTPAAPQPAAAVLRREPAAGRDRTGVR